MKGKIFFCQFSPDTWWTKTENFKKIAWFIFDLLLINWFFSECLAPSMVTSDKKCTKVTILGAKHSQKNQLISNKSNTNQAILLKFSVFVHQVSVLNWQKKFLPSLNQPASTSPFLPKIWTALATVFIGIYFLKKNFGEVLDLFQ